MSKATASELAWLERVAKEAERIADKHDPKRTQTNHFANALDSLCRIARTAYACGSGGRAMGY